MVTLSCHVHSVHESDGELGLVGGIVDGIVSVTVGDPSSTSPAQLQRSQHSFSSAKMVSPISSAHSAGYPSPNKHPDLSSLGYQNMCKHEIGKASQQRTCVLNKK